MPDPATPPATLLDKILGTLSEPSTWAGFAGLALAFGVSAPAWQQASAAGAALFGLVAVLRRERGGAA